MHNFDKYKHIIFDFDETIATLNLNWTEWFSGMEAIYRKYEPEYRGGDIEEMQNYFYKKYGRGIKQEADTFSRMFELNGKGSTTPIKETIELIKGLANANLYVWTSNDSATAKKYLEEIGILSRFKIVVGREMVDLLKPEPDGFNKYFKDLGDKEEFLFIGNSKFDEGAAENSGIEYLDVKEI